MLCGECILLNYGRPLKEGQQFAPCPHRELLYDPYAFIFEEACEDGERREEPVQQRA